MTPAEAAMAVESNALLGRSVLDEDEPVNSETPLRRSF